MPPSAAEQEVVSLRLQAVSLKADVTAQAARSRALETKLINAEADSAAYQEEAQRAVRLYEQLQAEGQEMHRAYVGRGRKVEELSATVQQLRGDLLAKDDAIAGLTRECARAAETLAASQAEAAAAAQRLQAELAASEAGNAGLLQRLAEAPAQDAAAALEATVAGLQAELAAVQDECDAMRHELAAGYVSSIMASASAHVASLERADAINAAAAAAAAEEEPDQWAEADSLAKSMADRVSAALQ